MPDLAVFDWLNFSQPLLWVGIGLLLLIAELHHGEGSLLAFGLSGFLVALILWITAAPIGGLWLAAIFAFGGLLMAMVTRRWIKKTERYKGDINTF